MTSTLSCIPPCRSKSGLGPQSAFPPPLFLFCLQVASSCDAGLDFAKAASAGAAAYRFLAAAAEMPPGSGSEVAFDAAQALLHLCPWARRGTGSPAFHNKSAGIVRGASSQLSVMPIELGLSRLKLSSGSQCSSTRSSSELGDDDAFELGNGPGPGGHPAVHAAAGSEAPSQPGLGAGTDRDHDRAQPGDVTPVD